MIDKGPTSGYNAYQEDGLPDMNGCLKLIEGFWRIVQQDLALGDMDARAWVEGECLPEFCEESPCEGFPLWVSMTTKQMSPNDIRDFVIEEYWEQPENIPKASKKKRGRPAGRPMGKKI